MPGLAGAHRTTSCSALDAWGAGPYQRPAANPLDKPAPIGNQLRPREQAPDAHPSTAGRMHCAVLAAVP